MSKCLRTVLVRTRYGFLLVTALQVRRNSASSGSRIRGRTSRSTRCRLLDSHDVSLYFAFDTDHLCFGPSPHHLSTASSAPSMALGRSFLRWLSRLFKRKKPKATTDDRPEARYDASEHRPASYSANPDVLPLGGTAKPGQSPGGMQAVTSEGTVASTSGPSEHREADSARDTRTRAIARFHSSELRETGTEATVEAQPPGEANEPGESSGARGEAASAVPERRSALETGWLALKEALKIAKECSDPCPPLKVALSGLVAVIEFVDVCGAFNSPQRNG